MSYLVIARKWRPRRFEDLVGQEPIARLLIGSIEQGKIAHAYIFSGPRGVGKTSTARILARAVNCEKGPTPSPCGMCASCASLDAGSAMDVMEIDGASNNSVNDIRDLRELVKYAPSQGRYKVYIIDEAHMLTDAAFNALLKTLEEPPPHVIFVLATTAPKRIPATVLSRCQHLPFRRVSSRLLKERLRLISDSEGIRITDGALDMLSRAADGSVRDSLTLLDQVAASLDEVTEADLKDLLSITDFHALSDIAEALFKGDRAMIIEIIYDLAERGADMRAFAKDLTKFLRDLLVSKLVKAPLETLDLTAEELNSLGKKFADVAPEMLTLMMSETMNAESDARFSAQPRVSLEMSLLKASFLSSLSPIGEAIKNIESLAGKTGPKEPQQMPRTEEKKPFKKEPVAEAPAIKKQAEPVPVQAEPVSLQAEPAPLTGESLLGLIIEKSDDKTAARLSNSTPDFKKDTLILTFKSTDEEISAKPLKENLKPIEEAASAIAGFPVKVKITIAAGRPAPRKKDLKERLMSEPAVREALELFEGTIVDVKFGEENAERKND